MDPLIQCITIKDSVKHTISPTNDIRLTLTLEMSLDKMTAVRAPTLGLFDPLKGKLLF